MKLEDYKAWLLQHGEIKEEYERPYAGFAVGDVTALACYKYIYDESKAYLEKKLKCLIKEE